MPEPILSIDPCSMPALIVDIRSQGWGNHFTITTYRRRDPPAVPAASGWRKSPWSSIAVASGLLQRVWPMTCAVQEIRINAMARTVRRIISRVFHVGVGTPPEIELTGISTGRAIQRRSLLTEQRALLCMRALPFSARRRKYRRSFPVPLPWKVVSLGYRPYVFQGECFLRSSRLHHVSLVKQFPCVPT